MSMSADNPRHILSNFHNALRELRQDVLAMGRASQHNLRCAVTGLMQRDDNLCMQAIANDEEVDQFEKKIDRVGIQILTLYQPVAGDLRNVVSTMKMSTNLERVSDEAGEIARRARMMLKNDEIPETKLLQPVYELAYDLLHDSIRAFNEMDLSMAETIDDRDDALDDAHNELVKLLRRRMEGDSSHLKDYLDLMFMVRSLERVGDHATNIAEDTIYVESAKDVRHLS